MTSLVGVSLANSLKLVVTMCDRIMQIPNTTTIAAIREARTGEGVTTYVGLDKLKREFD